MKTTLTFLLLALLLPVAAAAGDDTTPATLEGVAAAMDRILGTLDGFRHRLDMLEKKVDDGLWFDRVGDVAIIDKVRIYGPPRWKEESDTAIGAGNPVKFWCYTFFPRDLDTTKKAPLLVFPHGGVHSDFSTYYTHIVRELVAQGYVIVAPEYRGSTGYGRTVYENIDYGGLEVEDNHMARQYVLDNFDFVDGDRVGMIGWSHGGLISLMNVFEHPDDYKVAYAGVPVSDLIARLGYLGKEFEYEIYEDFPGGHSFDRLDSRGAREVRVKVYRFLARHLDPPRPITDLAALGRAGYVAPGTD
jgi:dienelactone hydrolase